jgi:hypothetical protein
VTVSADFTTELRRQIDTLESNRRGFLPMAQSFKDVMDFLGGDHELIDGIEYEAAQFQKMIDEDYELIKAMVKVLLHFGDYDIPSATFTADDARDHDASTVEPSTSGSTPVEPSKVGRTPRKATKVKGKRPSLRAKLTDAQIDEIRSIVREGWDCSYNQLASDFMVSRGTIWNIVKRKGAYA